ncbi:MAG: cytochrome c [Pirellulaceae bacterium]|nr:cytochrome c [Pirellulaceae bacterium]
MFSDLAGSKILFDIKIFLALIASISLCGCRPEPAAFQPNRLLVARMESELQVDLSSLERQAESALIELFGSPDTPHWPPVLTDSANYSTLVDTYSLARAAGPVGRDKKKVEHGLFRKHCAQCHGITGDGIGPAAPFLNPYPRDFRRGSFKFKSTVQGSKPTFDDLVRTIESGIPGTSMPAMANLARSSHYENDISILANYVRFLSIRGEVERRLMMELVRDIDEEADESLYDLRLKQTDPEQFASQKAKIDEVVQRVARSWLNAQVSKPSFRTEEPAASAVPLTFSSAEQRNAFIASAARGRKLFQGEIAACSQCHGTEGDGHGKLLDFDEWTKDWTIRAGIDPKDPKQWKPLKKLGLLKPVPSSARNLHLGVFRSGSSPDAIYHTIVEGIDGTPMPAAARLPSVKNGLTDEQTWDLVNFCQALADSDICQVLEAKDGN